MTALPAHATFTAPAQPMRVAPACRAGVMGKSKKQPLV
jgi:hypothetical protein